MHITPTECSAVPQDRRIYTRLCMEIDLELFRGGPYKKDIPGRDTIHFGNWMKDWFYERLIEYYGDIVIDYGRAGWKVWILEDPVRPKSIVFRAFVEEPEAAGDGTGGE